MSKYSVFEDPPLTKFFLDNTKMSWLWLVVRVYVGWQWLLAGWDKLHSPLWVGASSGKALAGFIAGALSKASGPHPDVQGWYAAFLQNVVLPHAAGWGHLVAFGEFSIGLALILGLFVGIAAFFGAFMNMNFLLSGSISINPIMVVLSFGLVLAWKIAGYLGLDFYALPALGTFWRRGKLFKKL